MQNQIQVSEEKITTKSVLNSQLEYLNLLNSHFANMISTINSEKLQKIMIDDNVDLMECLGKLIVIYHDMILNIPASLNLNQKD